MRDTDVLTVYGCTAVVTTLLDYPDQPTEGRQTQVRVFYSYREVDRLLGLNPDR